MSCSPAHPRARTHLLGFWLTLLQHLAVARCKRRVFSISPVEHIRGRRPRFPLFFIPPPQVAHGRQGHDGQIDACATVLLDSTTHVGCIAQDHHVL